MEVKEMLTCTFRSIDMLQVMKCYCDSYTLRVVHVLHPQTQVCDLAICSLFLKNLLNAGFC